MKPCPNQQIVDPPRVVACSLIPAEYMSAKVCERCQGHWPEGARKPAPDNPEVLFMRRLLTPQETGPPPSWRERLASSARALRQFVESGGKVLGRAEKEARLEICAGCDRQGHAIGCRVCAACGCFLGIKALLPHEHCPLGKWPGDPPRVEGGDCSSCG